MTKLTKDEMWKAVSENNINYDGMFFYAVKSTGIYCRPSCKSKVPKRTNVLFFDNANQAETAGFRPCKRCRSDILKYQPIKDIAKRTKNLIDDMFHLKYELNEEISQLGITQHRLREIFKEEYGVTLTKYISNLQLEEGKRLLVETDEKIIDIAYSIGFGSLSSFYRFFKKQTGKSPAVYRKESLK
ncbi:MAG: Ada metal-binding domain-containing protein [Gudongella sp.]|nr:Ada metal-binding domain-containing protein [Gudongella sp.]